VRSFVTIATTIFAVGQVAALVAAIIIALRRQREEPHPWK
jgi:hypothetical protein